MKQADKYYLVSQFFFGLSFLAEGLPLKMLLVLLGVINFIGHISAMKLESKLDRIKRELESLRHREIRDNLRLIINYLTIISRKKNGKQK